MITLESRLVQPFETFRRIISKGGPEPHEYEQLTKMADQVASDYASGSISDVDLQIMRNSFDEECLKTTLHGHSITKPYGYAGDFMIIDKIYREDVSSDERFEKWDIYWNNQPATKAVRNRKDYFIRE